MGRWLLHLLYLKHTKVDVWLQDSAGHCIRRLPMVYLSLWWVHHMVVLQNLQNILWNVGRGTQVPTLYTRNIFRITPLHMALCFLEWPSELHFHLLESQLEWERDWRCSWPMRPLITRAHRGLSFKIVLPQTYEGKEALFQQPPPIVLMTSTCFPLFILISISKDHLAL